MDTLLVFGSAVLLAMAAFFIWILASDSRAMKRTEVAEHSEMAAQSGNGPSRESDVDYGAADCFYDCMRVFRWEAGEESPCAEACGLKE